MCLAIFQPGETVIPTDHLKTGWVSNSDGGGFAFVNDGKIVISKGYTKWQDWLEAYEECMFMFPDSPKLLHFRIRSMGDRSVENTHPFELPDGMGALIHNGTLSGTGAQYATGKSDTALFVEKYGKVLTFENVQKDMQLIEDAIGYNKLAILYADGTHHIIGKAMGVTEPNGVWYSNETYLMWKDRGNKYAY